nr:ABC transporter substrate-binding protein [Naumannella cuiyingiana]
MKRRTLPRRWLAAIASLALALGLAVTGASAPARAEDPPRLRVALTSDIDTLNPFQAVFLTSTGLLRYQYEVIVGVGVNNEPVPGLASEWTTSPDAKVWTYTFPEGRLWSDGQPLTAEDARWTLQSIKDNEALGTANGGLVENMAEIAAPDPQTLVITLTEPQASNPGFEIPIVPKHVWENVDAETYPNDRDTVGSGPYVIKSYAQGQSVDLDVNPNFWRGPAPNGGLTYAVYRNLDAAVQALRSAEVDFVTQLTPAQFDSLANQPGITTNPGNGRRFTSVNINHGQRGPDDTEYGDGNAALKDPLVRQAIMHSIDNQALIDRVLQGYGEPGVTQEPPVYPDYFGLAAGTEPYAFDPAEANRLLDQAGYARGSDGKRLGPDRKPLQLRMLVRNSDPTHTQIADFVKAWLADVGIGVDVSAMSANQLDEVTTAGNYDLYVSGWSINPDPDYQLSINTCDRRVDAEGNGNSEANYCNPEFDELYAQQHTELDPARRAELVKQAWSIMYRDAVVRPVYYQQQLEAYRSDRFDAFTRQPAEGGIIAYQNYYWGFHAAAPAAPAAGPGGAGGAGGGMPVGGWVAIGVGVLLAIFGGVYLARRRGTSADDRE